MKNLMTKQNLIILGVGLATALAVYHALKNREKSPATSNKSVESTDATSDFCGCGA